MELDIWTIVSAGLGLIAAVAGGFWAKGKSKIAKIGKLAKETTDVITKLGAALEDNKITKEEVAQLKVELAEVKVAWKALFTKEINEPSS